MTQDEHDAKCWRLLKLAIVQSMPILSPEAREMSNQLQGLMTAAETEVERASGI